MTFHSSQIPPLRKTTLKPIIHMTFPTKPAQFKKQFLSTIEIAEARKKIEEKVFDAGIEQNYRNDLADAINMIVSNIVDTWDLEVMPEASQEGYIEECSRDIYLGVEEAVKQHTADFFVEEWKRLRTQELKEQ